MSRPIQSALSYLFLKGGLYMKTFFCSRNFIVLTIVTILLAAVMVYSYCTGGVGITHLFGAVATPMQKVTTVIANNAQTGFTDTIRSYDDLAAENQQLKEQINELNQKLINFYDYKQENQQLRNYLGLKRDNPDYQLVSAAVVGRDPNHLFYTFTADQGSKSGVKVNDPVITDQGVVGWVSKVSYMYCEITTILSPDTNIAAVDKMNRESGVINSEIQLADIGQIKLGLLEAGTTVQTGDTIVTSGIGGRFPKDLLIGKAVEVKGEENDVSLYATVEPFVDIKDVRDVVIITGFNGQGEVMENTSTNTDTSSGG